MARGKTEKESILQEDLFHIPNMVDGRAITQKTREKFMLSLLGYSDKKVFQLVDGKIGTPVARCWYRKKFKKMIKENKHLQQLALTTVERAMVDPNVPWHVKLKSAQLVLDRVEPITHQSEHKVVHTINPVENLNDFKNTNRKRLESPDIQDVEYEEIQEDSEE